MEISKLNRQGIVGADLSRPSPIYRPSNYPVKPHYRAPIIQGTFHCDPETEEHCITCSDEALEARVLRVDQETGLALVTIKDVTEEVDITLVESVAPGDLLLVHGGAAIAFLDKASDE